MNIADGHVRISFLPLGLETGEVFQGYEGAWSVEGIAVDPFCELYKCRSSVALCGDHILFPVLESGSSTAMNGVVNTGLCVVNWKTRVKKVLVSALSWGLILY